jgi:hypothetical protein
MAEHVEPLDVSDTSELLQLAEEVHRSHTSRILRRHGEDLAMVVPLPQGSATNEVVGKKTEADYQRFLSAAGAWADLDTEALKEYIYRAREEGTRATDHR